MKFLLSTGLIVFSLVVITSCLGSNKKVFSPSFTIDNDNSTFLMNGEPFQFISGSLHYFRVPHQYWRDRLRAMRAAGLNTVTTYVEWSFHEPEKGEYDWSGDKDLELFINTAIEENLYVVLRPGPYICAERDMGGFPYWLLHYYPNINLRTNDEDYQYEVTLWYKELMSKMQPYLFGKGGPIIMVQVENEYGSYPACDHEYMAWLAELTREWVGEDAVLFTTDWPQVETLDCGTTPDAYPTVDFGPVTNVARNWEMMRRYAGNGPLVNAEYYPGWMTHWGEKIARTQASVVTLTLRRMLQDKANVNIYVFYGGSNFDFSSGANLNAMYTPQITSYDYDAPMTEAGDPTAKYNAIRTVILEHFPHPGVEPPAVKPKWSSPRLVLEPVLHLLSEEGREKLGRKPAQWAYPPTMEAVKQRSGLILYESTISSTRPDPSVIVVDEVRDRGLIYLNNDYAGLVSRTRKYYSLSIFPDQGNDLQILVENQGRINFGPLINDFKGLVKNVTLNNNFIRDWVVTSFPLEHIEEALNTEKSDSSSDVFKVTSGVLKNGPVVYSVKFQIDGEELLDSYLDMTNWGKGYAWLNDRHLGRYWPREGPQVTLYAPGVYFKKYPEWNTITVLELQNAPSSYSVQFVGAHIGV